MMLKRILSFSAAILAILSPVAQCTSSATSSSSAPRSATSSSGNVKACGAEQGPFGVSRTALCVRGGEVTEVRTLLVAVQRHNLFIIRCKTYRVIQYLYSTHVCTYFGALLYVESTVRTGKRVAYNGFPHDATHVHAAAEFYPFPRFWLSWEEKTE